MLCLQKIENNNTEPAAGVAWTELKADMTAGDVGAYTKGEADQKFQPLGNYALKLMFIPKQRGTDVIRRKVTMRRQGTMLSPQIWKRNQTRTR